MKLSSRSFAHGQAIPEEFAFGKLADDAPMAFSDNRNPQLSWSELPAQTRSLVLLCIDTEVPTVMADVNQADRSIDINQPRQDFVHWVLIDIPADCREIAAGSCSEGVTSGGKREPAGPAGSRQGINDYTGFMGDGDYYGYDGPCPPWNDERMHRYHFRLYALDLEKLPIEDTRFTAAEVSAAMQGHILASAELSGSYSLNRAVRARADSP